MTPFDLIATERYSSSPFSVPCPFCGSVATYDPKETRFFPTNASCVAVDYGGDGQDSLRGKIAGQCRCNNRDCQEYIHFLGNYRSKWEDVEEYEISRLFVLEYFTPAIPLIRIPSKTPEIVKSLLKRSFAPAFFDQSASGNLLRSAIEALLTIQKVPQFAVRKKKRYRLSLHNRIEALPIKLSKYRDNLLAVKWIGNAASHNDLDIHSLKTAYTIVDKFLEELYGTENRELEKAIKNIIRRRRP